MLSNKDYVNEGPRDSCNGHGTHVAGIIGGIDRTKDFRFFGVAYNSKLSIYRVLNCKGSGKDVNIIKAMNDALDDNMDVVNIFSCEFWLFKG